MRKQKMTALLIAIIVVGVAAATVAFVPKKQMNIVQRPNQNQNATSSQQMPTQTVTTTQIKNSTEKDASVYTFAQIAEHKDAKSCWTAINGNVYELTAWIKQHPGGSQAILSICGKDGTAAFEGQHGGDKKPEAMLATFKIGTVESK